MALALQNEKIDLSFMVKKIILYIFALQKKAKETAKKQMDDLKAELAGVEKGGSKKNKAIPDPEDMEEGEPEDCSKDPKPTLAAAQRESTGDKTGTAISEEFETSSELE